jgi:hypothetical protein
VAEDEARRLSDMAVAVRAAYYADGDAWNRFINGKMT